VPNKCQNIISLHFLRKWFPAVTIDSINQLESFDLDLWLRLIDDIFMSAIWFKRMDRIEYNVKLVKNNGSKYIDPILCMTILTVDFKQYHAYSIS
jgi:hypothetical protein